MASYINDSMDSIVVERQLKSDLEEHASKLLEEMKGIKIDKWEWLKNNSKESFALLMDKIEEGKSKEIEPVLISAFASALLSLAITHLDDDKFCILMA